MDFYIYIFMDCCLVTCLRFVIIGLDYGCCSIYGYIYLGLDFLMVDIYMNNILEHYYI